jgi:hypothetical protein
VSHYISDLRTPRSLDSTSIPSYSYYQLNSFIIVRYRNLWLLSNKEKIASSPIVGISAFRMRSIDSDTRRVVLLPKTEIELIEIEEL